MTLESPVSWIKGVRVGSRPTKPDVSVVRLLVSRGDRTPDLMTDGVRAASIEYHLLLWSINTVAIGPTSFNPASGTTLTENVERTKTSGGLARLVKRSLAFPFVILAAIVILVEDWLWQDLARLAAAIGRLPVLRSVEAFIVTLPPYPALLFFATPALLLVPLKLVALYFLSHGQATLGLLTIIAAKLAGTALVARIFTLTRPQLLRIGWFAWLYQRFIDFKTRIYATVKATAIYRLVHDRHLRMRNAFRLWRSKRRGFWVRRWLATRRLARRRKQP